MSREWDDITPLWRTECIQIYPSWMITFRYEFSGAQYGDDFWNFAKTLQTYIEAKDYNKLWTASPLRVMELKCDT